MISPIARHASNIGRRDDRPPASGDMVSCVINPSSVKTGDYRPSPGRASPVNRATVARSGAERLFDLLDEVRRLARLAQGFRLLLSLFLLVEFKHGHSFE